MPSRFVACLEWQRLPNDRIRREIHRRRRHFHNTKTSLVNYLHSDTKPEEMLSDDSAAATVQELGHALVGLDVHGNVFGACSLSVVVLDRDRFRLDQSVDCVKAFATHGGRFSRTGYATLWFTTPFLLLNVVASFVYVFVARFDGSAAPQPLPEYPPPERAPICSWSSANNTCARSPSARRALVAGHSRARPLHRHDHRRRHRDGQDLGLHVSLRRAAPRVPGRDPKRKVGGLVLEVKGDFCQQVRGILERHGRGDDYIEVGLDSVYRYNPLHNDLDAYALAYGIATLMTNLYGRGKEPFWQQASTNLVKFVILLHQVLDDYVTLFQVYEHVINPDKLRARIAEGDERFGAKERRLVVPKGRLRRDERV